MDHRRATTQDADAITEVIASAFETDPFWAPTLAGTPHPAAWWRSFVDGALRFDDSSVAGDVDAVTLWIPPGQDEMSEEQLFATLALAARDLEGGMELAEEIFAVFDAAHPHDEPHHYLTLFATRPSRRGSGVGMALLRDDLARFDVEGVPTYLESSNPGNDERYAREGFRAVGRFEHPRTGAPVTTMWRPVGG